MRPHVLLMLALARGDLSAAPSATSSPDLAPAVRSAVAAIGAPGVAVAILSGDRVIVSEGVGGASVETGVAVAAWGPT